jgi:hypothetical protein
MLFLTPELDRSLLQLLLPCAQLLGLCLQRLFAPAQLTRTFLDLLRPRPRLIRPRPSRLHLGARPLLRWPGVLHHRRGRGGAGGGSGAGGGLGSGDQGGGGEADGGQGNDRGGGDAPGAHGRNGAPVAEKPLHPMDQAGGGRGGHGVGQPHRPRLGLPGGDFGQGASQAERVDGQLHGAVVGGLRGAFLQATADQAGKGLEKQHRLEQDGGGQPAGVPPLEVGQLVRQDRLEHPVVEIGQAPVGKADLVRAERQGTFDDGGAAELHGAGPTGGVAQAIEQLPGAASHRQTRGQPEPEPRGGGRQAQESHQRDGGEEVEKQATERQRRRPARKPLDRRR